MYRFVLFLFVEYNFIKPTHLLHHSTELKAMFIPHDYKIAISVVFIVDIFSLSVTVKFEFH